MARSDWATTSRLRYLGFVAFAFLIWYVGPRNLFQALAGTNLSYLFAALVLNLPLIGVKTWRRHGGPTGRCLAGLLVAIFVISVSISFFPVFHVGSWLVSRQRAQIESQLLEDGHRHVILVTYGSYYYPYPHLDWVYNRADIDAAQVIWARDLGPAPNRKLVDYFKDPKIWCLNIDRLGNHKAALEPYSLDGAIK